MNVPVRNNGFLQKTHQQLLCCYLHSNNGDITLLACSSLFTKRLNITAVNFFLPRMLILRKKPTLLKLSCGVIVVVGLFICLIPTIFPDVDPKSEKRKNDAQGVSRVMWPMIFMLGFVSTTLCQRNRNFTDAILGLINPSGQSQMA